MIGMNNVRNILKNLSHLRIGNSIKHCEYIYGSVFNRLSDVNVTKIPPFVSSGN